MSSSLETKAICADPTGARTALDGSGAVVDRVVEQSDSYFAAAHGRVKLRSTRWVDPPRPPTAELIAYDRPDLDGARLSRHWVVPIGDEVSCREGLAAVLGVVGTVDKLREVWRIGRTTVHLDHVRGLGDFVELETACVDGTDPAAHAEHRRICEVLGIRPEDTVAGSYGDLVRAVAPGAGG